MGAAVTYTLGAGTTTVGGDLTIGHASSTNSDILTALTNNMYIDVALRQNKKDPSQVDVHWADNQVVTVPGSLVDYLAGHEEEYTTDT